MSAHSHEFGGDVISEFTELVDKYVEFLGNIFCNFFWIDDFRFDFINSVLEVCFKTLLVILTACTSLFSTDE